ncbi:lipopolysaccharide biosynthesis protein [Acidipropionibacterium jensenii]|uniref:lipopolysaccharide biosynthesis protein n=1 Tax=Acidipropionibacterium jensenii TaxID=1749 RepID=UPI0026488D5D|nr:lipopolysaccharide biosynthesis protein [Acidipropionibacterium jensenii]MDN5978084.1 lipopolysaccharide biosynthesis protein [Acidipropionibacterium jensenii]MDN5995191.1 lipopolysaccharide biosynthesis protein [Acidipropionibacterium jensenii]MDN6021244.1 lipopolysaccharide biosynthesis protein [Acidipropionibacterium jensenii]MDN6426554.1 lipopolysaccharide biosynthesis protein [Acidipropionibacterium jensenii]MDN6441804.1 lipopolysaccharide biosynthesis protein [Acidipropionibacterium j
MGLLPRTAADDTSDPGSPSLGATAARGAVWSGVSTVILRLGSVLVGVVLARILSPDQFGLYAVALTVQGILMTVADLGLSAEIIRSEEPERVAPTVATFGLISGTSLTVATVALSGPLATLLGDHRAGSAIAVLSLTLLLAGVSIVPYGLMLRRFQQRELFLISLVDLIVSTAVTFILIAAGLGVLSLAIGRVAAQAVSSTLQFMAARVRPRFGLDRTRWRAVLAFSLPIAGANLFTWILLNVDNVVIARLAGATALGFYVLGFNIANWPMSALSQMVRSIAMPYVSRVKDSAGALPMLTSVIWAMALPAGVTLAALADPLVHVIYGAKWAPSVPVLAALGLYGSLRVIFDLFAAYLYALGRSRGVLWLQVLTIVVLTTGMILMTTRHGIVGAAWVHVGASVIFILPGYLGIIRATGVRLGALARACLRPTLATVPACLAALAACHLISAPVIALLVGGAGAVAVYLAVMGRWLLARVRQVRGPKAG